MTPQEKVVLKAAEKYVAAYNTYEAEYFDDSAYWRERTSRAENKRQDAEIALLIAVKILQESREVK